jgi:hypothetical protein
VRGSKIKCLKRGKEMVMKKILMLSVLFGFSLVTVGCNLLNVEGDVGSNNDIKTDVKADVKVDSGAKILSDNKIDSGAVVVKDNSVKIDSGAVVVKDNSVKIDSGAVVVKDNSVKIDSGAVVVKDNSVVVNVGIPAVADWNKKLGYELFEGSKNLEWEETNTQNAPKIGKHLDTSMNYYNVVGLDTRDVQLVKAELGPYTEYMVYELGIVIYRTARGIDYVYAFKKDGSLRWWTLFKLSDVLK